MELIPVQPILNALIFSMIGFVFFFVAFQFFDKVTPGNLWREILEQHNTALAIIMGAVALGISLIIAAAIHG